MDLFIAKGRIETPKRCLSLGQLKVEREIDTNTINLSEAKEESVVRSRGEDLPKEETL